jgi:hypothetical protein
MHVIPLTYVYYYLKLLERYTTVNAVPTRMIWQHRMWFSEISNSGGLFGYLLFRWPISSCWFAFCRGSWMRVWARRHRFSAMDTTSLGSIDLAVTQHRCVCVYVCVCVCVCVASATSMCTNIQPYAYIHTYMNAYIQRAKFQPKYDEVTGTKLGLTTQTINGRSLFKSRRSWEISACLDDEVTKFIHCSDNSCLFAYAMYSDKVSQLAALREVKRLRPQIWELWRFLDTDRWAPGTAFLRVRENVWIKHK